ncbi:PREDICTED: 39S ribosomal protein L52, mitochondrial-like [Priapulus caudatus]|uniref:Large ribosomal subunit protein mL52 n=1 Tax=Priapulus caudatus TaxID=37621 RepID=A0ABM1F2W8_PRICU|nr:PREDICTED: 39S ribosomal protein L52, mitochondrial-like [Priapulus caudatus]
MAAPLALHPCCRHVSLIYGAFSRQVISRSLHTSPAQLAGSKWRQAHGLPDAFDSDYGPFVDKPDWSYADGRPAPPTSGMKQRKEERKVLATQALQHLRAMERGKEGYRNIVEADNRRKQGTIGAKLGEKGENYGKALKSKARKG